MTRRGTEGGGGGEQGSFSVEGRNEGMRTAEGGGGGGGRSKLKGRWVKLNKTYINLLQKLCFC